jgi:hypothetical protein
MLTTLRQQPPGNDLAAANRVPTRLAYQSKALRNLQAELTAY